jgi:hypothetical protein
MRLIPLPLEAILVTHHESLEKLAFLHRPTGVGRTHEYTLSNLKFARAVEPVTLQLFNYSKRCEGATLRQRKNGFR